MRRLVVVLGILWAVTAAMAQDGIFAEPTVLKCRPVETRGLEDAWRQVDRIDLDARKMSIKFSVSNTLGSSQEKFWLFANRSDSLFHDHVVVEPDGESLAIAAIYTNIPVGILISGRSMVQVLWLYPAALKYAKFACE